MSEHGWITVGIDGTAGSDAAVLWAAREADRVGARLRLVHVFDDYVPMAGFYAAAYPRGSVEGRQVAEKLVRDASRSVAAILPEDRREPVVLRGDRRAGLLRAAADSDLMVLGDEPHPARGRMLTGSIIGGVAAHSSAPVVVVPADCADTPARGVVVVGVKFFAASRELVRQAFEVAADRSARLVVLHAWEYSAPYDNMVFSHLDLVGWEERSAKELRQVVDDTARDFSHVQSEVRFVRGQPAQVLTDASAEADLLAIARRPHGFPLGHFGSTGRATLRETRCPAIVLPPAVETVPIATTG